MNQTTIGWLDMFEGLAASSWQQLQGEYYLQKGWRKSSRQWIKTVLTALHHMGWKQWDHRNKINKRVTKPDEAAAIAALDHSITVQLTTRMHEMLPGDAQRFDRNLINLLNASTATKNSWLVNVSHARQRYFRIQEANANLDLISQEQSHLLKWMRGEPYHA